MFSRNMFILVHQLWDKNFYSNYVSFNKNQWKSYAELKTAQEKQLRHMVSFAYDNVPYYHGLFNQLGLTPADIKVMEDLGKLPVLTKEIIKNNWEALKPVNLNKIGYYYNSTGGSSGIPLKYRLSKKERFLGAAIMYRGWGYGGYELGDRMAFLAGASLDVGTKPYVTTRVHEIARNLKKISSFDMGPAEMKNSFEVLNSFKPRYLRGYASSINFFAKYIEDNGLEVSPLSAVFTTSEKLYPQMREKIETVFGCEVYDNYGLNDGGISAYECSEHCGLHIDVERSVMEVVDLENSQLENGCGSILATSLYNYSMPFIRYDTGDMGHILDESCSCGRGFRLLKEVVGRSVDILFTPEGKAVHGWFFLYILWEYCKGIKEYQVVQESLERIVIKIVQEDDFDERQLDEIRKIVRKKSEGWELEFRFVKIIERASNGKYKFIINEVKL